MSLDQDIAELAKQPLLGLLERDALRLLAFAAETRTLRAGDILFRTGETADGAFLVLSGAISLTSQDDGGPADEVVRPGALIGELALFTATKRPVSAIAREPTQLMKLSRSVMRRVLAEFPGSAQDIADVISERLRTFVGELGRVERALNAIDRK
jgi:CRP-like cAMP-binding protein